MKRMVWLVMLALFTTGRLWAVTEAVFTSVTGKVEIRGHKGHMLRLAEKDSTVVEGGTPRRGSRCPGGPADL